MPNPVRWLRRWWARITHRHEYEVIWRKRLRCDPENCCICPCILQIKRCWCGHELVQKWTANWSWEKRKWRHVDPDWMDCFLHEQGIELPARHQE